MKKVRVFVSSVQKELEIERVAMAGWVSTDARLADVCEVVLFDKEPLSGIRVTKPYLACLKTCDIYLLILDCEYGRPPEPLSATHEEYRFARERNMPQLVFIKGMTDVKREPKTKAFLDEIKADGNTYKRFHDRLDLEPEVKKALKLVLTEAFNLAVEDEVSETAVAVEAASPFEQQALDISAGELDGDTAETWLRSIKAVQDSRSLSTACRLNALRQKGLVRLEGKVFRTQASGLLFLGKDPARHFPQCRVFADAFRGTEPDSTPADQVTLSGPAPVLVDQVWDFVQKNTRHPMRVVGFTRISLDEYPREAVREAIVNAVAHRDYEDSSRQILVKLFAHRLEILSPGGLMRPLTVQKLRKGDCHPCSRNPVLGQYLNHLRLMDQRGSGIRRMKTAMLNHGLDEPKYDLVDGYFRIVMQGPGDHLERLRVPHDTTGAIPAAVEDRLNERHKKILERCATEGSVSTAWVMGQLGIVRDTARRDFAWLIKLGLLDRQGSGRSTRYISGRGSAQSTDNRPMRDGK
jgi:ATP-dependent DNA helicase RecG